MLLYEITTASNILEELTHIILSWSEGHKSSEEKLFVYTYERFKQIATVARTKVKLYNSNQYSMEDVICSTTSLVHEAYIKLATDKKIDIESSKDFFLLVSTVMRHILIDHYRKLSANKRKFDKDSSLKNNINSNDANNFDYISIDHSINKLSNVYPRQAETFQLRYFLGLKNKEIAKLQSVSESLIDKDLRFAKNWIANL